MMSPQDNTTHYLKMLMDEWELRHSKLSYYYTPPETSMTKMLIELARTLETRILHLEEQIQDMKKPATNRGKPADSDVVDIYL